MLRDLWPMAIHGKCILFYFNLNCTIRVCFFHLLILSRLRCVCAHCSWLVARGSSAMCRYITMCARRTQRECSSNDNKLNEYPSKECAYEPTHFGFSSNGTRVLKTKCKINDVKQRNTIPNNTDKLKRRTEESWKEQPVNRYKLKNETQKKKN